MAPPLSRSIVGVSSSAKSLHFPSAPSSFVRFSSRRRFRCDVATARLGAFTFTRSCSCHKVLAHDCMFSGGPIITCNSLKSVDFPTDTSCPRDTPGLDEDNLLVDCSPDQECVTGGIVALGKFDALHLGHRQLAIQASRVGSPFLLSFVGIAEVLGWERRAPVVAKCDRKRVLSTWAPLCGGSVPLEFQVEFSRVRHLSPREFVERLAKDLRIAGVVAGENYRFGYRASGDAAQLVGLCEEHGLEAHILSSVVDGEEPVSSTRVRQALALGEMDDVARLLGRKHRLMLRVEDFTAGGRILSVPRTCALNQEPREGLYEECSLLVGGEVVGPCHVAITQSHVHVELLEGLCPGGESQVFGVDFGR